MALLHGLKWRLDMGMVFAPGCALKLYKPELTGKTLDYLRKNVDGSITELMTCCDHDPHLPLGTVVINACPGCDRTYSTQFMGVGSISLWEVIVSCADFPYPDYHGAEMTVLDACVTRANKRAQDAVRILLERMNIKVIEADHIRQDTICCGDKLFGHMSDEDVHKKMREREEKMPREDVANYCMGCTRAIEIGGRTPRYLLDLLFGEETTKGILTSDRWNSTIEKYADEH